MRPAHLARSFETVYLPGRPGAAPHCTGRVFDGLSTRPLRVLQFNTLADGLAQNGSFSKVQPRATGSSPDPPLISPRPPELADIARSTHTRAPFSCDTHPFAWLLAIHSADCGCCPLSLRA